MHKIWRTKPNYTSYMSILHQMWRTQRFLSSLTTLFWSLLYKMNSLRGYLNRIKYLCLYEQELNLVIFIHSTVSLSTFPYPLPKLVLYRLRSSASSFYFRGTLISLRHPVATYFFFLVLPSHYSSLYLSFNNPL